jgi:hypothetical protein
MKNIYLYTPEICDGGFCCKDCDRCPKADKALERMEEENDLKAVDDRIREFWGL